MHRVGRQPGDKMGWSAAVYDDLGLSVVGAIGDDALWLHWFDGVMEIMRQSWSHGYRHSSIRLLLYRFILLHFPKSKVSPSSSSPMRSVIFVPSLTVVLILDISAGEVVLSVR